MVVGDAQNGNDAATGQQQQQQQQKQLPAPTQQPPFGLQQATIDNIMSGIENTGAVKMNNHRKKLRQRFDIIKKLGQGTYGKVQLGINKETGQEVAIKTIKKSKIETEADLIRIRREVQIMSSVQHPNIIHIYEVFENREKMVLVMEFAAGGELYDYLSDRKVLTEEEARRIFRQVSTAIYYCHKHKICHRDLKLENILLDEHGNAKIADFGLSNVFDDQRLLATFCGSPLYASPEIVKGTPYQGPEVDCWSLGVLLYTLVYGAMPFDGANFKRLVKQISQGDYFEPKKPSRASPLIREMLTVCPIRRANIEQICNHWWVNESYQESCLDLAEELANQTPVRLDVLLSLAPPSVTSDQVVVPTHADDAKDRVQRSHSVGSVIDIAESEAERRILDMVAAGGEQALMPSPTRTITPSESPAQPKRKLESTVSTENATGGAKKKERPISDLKSDPSRQSIPEAMEIETEPLPTPPTAVEKDEKKDKVSVKESLKKIEELCDELMEKVETKKEDEESTPTPTPRKEVVKKVPSPARRDTVKYKTSDLSGAINALAKEQEQEQPTVIKQSVPERQNSLPEESQTVVKPVEKRRSRILETAEKFQNMNNQNNEKYRKFTIPGVSVGNFKKEFERKASLTQIEPRKLLEKRDSLEQSGSGNSNNYVPRKNSSTSEQEQVSGAIEKTNSNFDNNKNSSTASSASKIDEDIGQSDSKSSVHSFSLEEARRSMESSIALLQRAKNESQAKEMDQLCNKTEEVMLANEESERDRKLRAAREIIGNAIPPSRLIGVRKPPVYGINGRSISGSVMQTPAPRSGPLKTHYSADSMEPQSRPTLGRYASQRSEVAASVVPEKVIEPKLPDQETTKTSRAEITLKSATLPRRKPTKTEVQVDIKPNAEAMRFSSELHHQVPDLRSAPIREHPTTYASFTLQNRSNSLEPQAKELAAHIQKPPYQRTTSNSYRNPLSRQSTNESNDSDTTPTQSYITSTVTSSATIGSDKQPIKKSPREFIIPISVEGGGVVTPRANSIEQSESNLTQSSSMSGKRISRPRRISSIFKEDSEEESTVFPKLNRHTSIGRESDSEEPRFHSMHRLRSSRPTKRTTSTTTTTTTQDPNESGSSGEEDDDDGFELLTAENLFSTLLSRVRALTHRMNVKNETSSNFPSTRLLNDFRQQPSPFWNNDPFGSSSNMNPWRHSMARDIQSDIDSMFSRSGATLPRGKKTKTKTESSTDNSRSSTSSGNDKNNNVEQNGGSIVGGGEVLDLGDLDLSQLRLSKKELETLSNLTPSLSKNLQDQLLAQLPPTQAKKLSRTLSVQGGKSTSETSQIYRRSMSNNPRDLINRFSRDSITPTNEIFDSINNNHSVITTTSSSSSSRYRRSMSRDDRNEDTVNNNSRSGSYNRDGALSPINDKFTYEKYKSYSNNLKALNGESKSMDYEKTQRSVVSPIDNEYVNVPPRSCLSPPPLDDRTIKKTQKKISRFLCQDNGVETHEESRKSEKANRELETQKILREIREKSRDRSIDRGAGDAKDNRLSYLLDKYSNNDKSKHLQNRSFGNLDDEPDSYRLKAPNVKSENTSSGHSQTSISSTINDKILDELNNISLLNSQLERFDQLEIQEKEKSLKVKKTKVKSTDGVKKVTKKVKETTPEINIEESYADEVSEKSTVKRESKMLRPKSYPSKEPGTLQIATAKSADMLEESMNSTISTSTSESSKMLTSSKLSRPKSFPNSKIAPPKESSLRKFPESLTEVLNNPKEPSPPKMSTKKKEDEGETSIADEIEPKKIKKVIKVVKKSSKLSIPMNSTELEQPKEPELKKEKSPEKKSKGILYSIGQKFEKLREPKKDKKALETKDDEAVPETSIIDNKEKKKKIKAMLNEDVDEVTKQERKSKIDAMIRNLREKSIPHNTELTESGLIKRAVSVEEMPHTFNKNTVNKVLGLFKRIEKENCTKNNKVQNTKSTSYISAMEAPTSNGKSFSSLIKERPKSSGFVTKIKKNPSSFEPLNNISESRIPVKFSCPDCKEPEIVPSRSSTAVTKRHSTTETKQSTEEKERIRNNRKGLMLDLNKFTQNESELKKSESNPKKLVGSSSGSRNNYSFPPPLPQEANHSHLTPTYDNLTNYSSSPYDESTSTYISPTEDHEPFYDGWSTCSDDHTLPPHPLGTSSLSRLSRHSQMHTQVDAGESPDESVVDRIRRKSFYSRFNEKKPKRVSTIVGSAAKDYYRERSRPLEYTKSATSIIPDLSGKSPTDYSSIRSVSRYPSTNRSLSQSRPLKYSSDKPPITANDIIPHSSSYRRLNYDSNHIASLPPPHHHHHHHDLLRKSPDDITARIKANRNTMYDSSSSSSNTTPSLSSIYAKRRSFTTTPSNISSSSAATYSTSNTSYNGTTKPSFVDSYATIGRKMRQYNARSASLLDPSTINSSNGYTSSHVSEHRNLNGYGDLNGSISRNLRFRNSSVPRSPTNI